MTNTTAPERAKIKILTTRSDHRNIKGLTVANFCCNYPLPPMTDDQSREPNIGFSRLTEFLGDPELDEGLPGDAEPLGLPIEALDDPSGEIDVDALRFRVQAPGLGPVDLIAHVLARVELSIKCLRFHIVRSLSVAPVSPK